MAALSKLIICSSLTFGPKYLPPVGRFGDVLPRFLEGAVARDVYPKHLVGALAPLLSDDMKLAHNFRLVVYLTEWSYYRANERREWDATPPHDGSTAYGFTRFHCGTSAMF